MKKVCKHCNIEYDATDTICCECGHPLSKVDDDSKISAQMAGSQQSKTVLTDCIGAAPFIGGATINEDNRIHKGDKINVGGDSFNAQSVDNRTVTTNTTINNIQTIVDESKELVKCEISGKRVYKIDSYECPICGRTVASEFYVKEKRKCIDCVEKSQSQKPAEQSATRQESKPLPPMMESNEPFERVSVEPIQVKKDTGKMRKIIIGVSAVVVLVVGVFALMPSKHSESAKEVLVSTDGVQQGVVETVAEVVEPATKKAPVSSMASCPSVANTSVTVSKNPPSAFAEGKEAFDAKDFSKAKLFFEQALNNGEAQGGYYLSLMYQRGNGVGRSAQSAFGFMLKAAEGGCADAYYEVGEMYRLGKGTEVNRALAKQWYEKSVMSGGKGSDMASQALTKYN